MVESCHRCTIKEWFSPSSNRCKKNKWMHQTCLLQFAQYEWKFLSTIDSSDAYYQIKIADNCRDYTAFKVGTKGTFRYVRMAMGICNSTWCELVDRVIGCDLEPECFSYMDDFVIATDTFERHLEVLQTLLTRLNNAGLKISAEKSFFRRDSINFLGYIIMPEGVKCNEEKVKAIVDLPRPTTIRKIRQFIGMVGSRKAWCFHKTLLSTASTDNRSLEKFEGCTLHMQYRSGHRRQNSLWRLIPYYINLTTKP